ncbi:MAG: hypothetical protein O7B99_14785, partial [Planctomycetota bacterium]|nr:hypothetical protein [Planctomycetota bacterium]
FAAAVLHLLRDSGLREKLAEGGRARAQDFCHREEARRTLELLSARAAGPPQGKEADLGRPTRSEPQASEGGPPQD